MKSKFKHLIILLSVSLKNDDEVSDPLDKETHMLRIYGTRPRLLL